MFPCDKSVISMNKCLIVKLFILPNNLFFKFTLDCFSPHDAFLSGQESVKKEVKDK